MRKRTFYSCHVGLGYIYVFCENDRTWRVDFWVDFTCRFHISRVGVVAKHKFQSSALLAIRRYYGTDIDFTFGWCGIVVSVSVRLLVCHSVHSRNYMPILYQILGHVTYDSGSASSSGVAICYILPVLLLSRLTLTVWTHTICVNFSFVSKIVTLL